MVDSEQSRPESVIDRSSSVAPVANWLLAWELVPVLSTTSVSRGDCVDHGITPTSYGRPVVTPLSSAVASQPCNRRRWRVRWPGHRPSTDRMVLRQSRRSDWYSRSFGRFVDGLRNVIHRTNATRFESRSSAWTLYGCCCYIDTDAVRCVVLACMLR